MAERFERFRRCQAAGMGLMGQSPLPLSAGSRRRRRPSADARSGREAGAARPALESAALREERGSARVPLRVGVMR